VQGRAVGGMRFAGNTLLHARGGIPVAPVSGNHARTDHFVLDAGTDEVRTQDTCHVSSAVAIRGDSNARDD
jgi:hypothetical protein